LTTKRLSFSVLDPEAKIRTYNIAEIYPYLIRETHLL